MVNDYIERQVAVDDLREILNDPNCPLFVSATVHQILESIPAADVRPVVYGEWETSSDRPDTLICSVCGCGYDIWKHDPHNYCPNCGCYIGGKANG